MMRVFERIGGKWRGTFIQVIETTRFPTLIFHPTKTGGARKSEVILP
jgi:hypothetical protein